MSRTVRYKLVYFGTVAALCLAGLAICWAFDFAGWVVAPLAVAAFLPGQVQGHYYRDLFRSRRLLSENRPAEALDAGRNFIRQLEERPWMRRLVWLAGFVYTPHAEVMALTNCAAAELALGRTGDAAATCERALAVDPLAPLPVFNLGLARWMEGDRDEAERLAERAEDLGYDGGATDQLVQRGSALLAAGHGTTTADAAAHREASDGGSGPDSS